jgi:hypothetical protein
MAGRPLPNRLTSNKGCDCLFIVLSQCAIALLLRPFQNAPFIDDAFYAWPVEHLLSAGRLAALEYANNLNATQVLWGALFCLPGGFAFAALRVSTWTLATAGLCAFYLLLREVNVSRRDALIGTAVLGFNPIFFILQFSFMTDVPFLALTVAATCAFVRAVNRSGVPWLVAAVVLATLACGVRVVGAVWPVAAALTLLCHSRFGFGSSVTEAGRSSWPLGKPRYLILTLTPLLAFALLALYTRQHTFRPADISDLPNSPAHRVADLKSFALPLLPEMSIAAVLTAAAVLGPALLPLTIPLLAGRRGGAAGATTTGPRIRRTILIAFVLAIAAYFMPEWLSPLHSGSTWSWRELGYVDVANRPALPPPAWLMYPLAGIAVVSFAAALAHLPRPRGDAANVLLAWQALGHVLIIAILWLCYDRFLLILLPIAIVFLVRAPLPRPRWSVALVIPLAVICLVGTRDHLAYNRALMDAVAWVRAHGAPPREISAGYAQNAWLQYAHPENAPRDPATGRPIVPGFTTDLVPRYEISDHPLPDTVTLHTVPCRRWLGPDAGVYVLEYPQELNRPRKHE